MNNIGRIICYGACEADASTWHCSKHYGINRLYYICGGTGGYVHNKEKREFEKGYLYYIPYCADFTPYCSENNPIFHIYIDFELIPPVITDDILELNTANDERLAAAVGIFALGGTRTENQHTHLEWIDEEKEYWRFCSSSILYLVSEIVKRNNVSIPKDELVIKSLEIMHTQMKERITVGGIAEKLYINEDSFIRRFSKVVGTTPYAYLKTLRLRTALSLRNNQNLSLAEIATETGYSDATALLHALKGKF